MILQQKTRIVPAVIILKRRNPAKRHLRKQKEHQDGIVILTQRTQGTAERPRDMDIIISERS